MAYDGNLPAPTFDLDTYANNYQGALLPIRLAHISTHCPSLSRHALSSAIDAAKQGKDVQLYARLHDIADRLGFADLAKMDTAWASKQEEANRRELSRLEGELRGYKNNMIRESIRMGQDDLAAHQLSTGGPVPDPNDPHSQHTSGYNAAYQAYGKMRDYCTTPTHIASMTLRLIYTSLLQAVSSRQAGGSPTMYYNTAVSNAHRIRTIGVKEEEMDRLVPIMNASLGIAYLGNGSYRDAASYLLSTHQDYATLGAVHNTDFPRMVASGNDIAVYGGLCALATMDREQLLTRVLGGPFRFFLELEPHMRKAISLYTTAKYEACLNTLRHYHADWSLDVFLGPHVDLLFARIREKSITAYFSSFSQVSLSSLASTFPPAHTTSSDVQHAMELEALSMIQSGTLAARLDVVNGLLVAPRTEARAATHADAKAAADEVERTLLLRLQRVNAVVAGLEVPRGKGGGAQQAGW
ncbi:uncharacterized protein LTR77_002000 [Saxophila tyrrhenica]|uniref:PCI domain-containing protein n=1 Tax=Saxophila tyrrhenica TaxID=1690608 RepID=A0AAV9PI96_9PEZI|nr:hypothetical protein LTR77_002000 [Saxophila tyrrhenica]